MNTSGWLRLAIGISLFLSISIGFAGRFAQARGETSMNISEGDEWQYSGGTKEPSPKWNNIRFEISSKEWQSGQTGLGYGNERVRTQLADMKGKYLAVYARRDFTLSSTEYGLLQQNSTELMLSIVCDGPFKAWINGVEVIRSHDERVALDKDFQEPLDIDITSFAQELLLVGSNVLAIRCANDRIDSDNFLFIPSLTVKIAGE